MIYRDRLLEWMGAGLIMHAAASMDHDVFLMMANTPMGPQPSAVLLISTKNPLVGEPPLMAANIIPLSVTKQEVLDSVEAMVNHLVKQRAELMDADKAPPSSSGLILP